MWSEKQWNGLVQCRVGVPCLSFPAQISEWRSEITHYNTAADMAGQLCPKIAVLPCRVLPP